jgi:predicted transcriptional regulator
MLDDEIMERAKTAHIVKDALDADVYELDDEEAAAVAEGIADMKAGQWISHDEMMKKLKEQRGR